MSDSKNEERGKKVIPISEGRRKEVHALSSLFKENPLELQYIHITAFPPKQKNQKIYIEYEGDFSFLISLLKQAHSLLKQK